MQENKIRILLRFIIFITLLSISFYMGSRYTSKNIQVQYISQSEILNIEKKRIRNDLASDQQLFFGSPELAIKYIGRAQKQRSKGDVLVFLTDGKIYGPHVRSISKEVHEEIIKNLAQPAKRK